MVLEINHLGLLTGTKLYKPPRVYTCFWVKIRQTLCTHALLNHKKNNCQLLFTRSDRDKTQSTVLPHGGTRTGTCWLRGCCADGQASCTSCLSTWTTSSTHYSGRRWDLLLTFNSLQYKWVNYDFLHFSVNKYTVMWYPFYFQVKKLPTVHVFGTWLGQDQDYLGGIPRVVVQISALTLKGPL